MVKRRTLISPKCCNLLLFRYKHFKCIMRSINVQGTWKKEREEEGRKEGKGRKKNKKDDLASHLFNYLYLPSTERNQRSNCQHLLDHWKIKRVPEKHLFLLYWSQKPKLLTVWITINCGKFWKRWEYQTTWPASWEICMRVRKQQLELDMEQQNGSKLGKESIKAVYFYPAYLTYMQSTSWEMLG